jgi:hypothetical protein
MSTVIRRVFEGTHLVDAERDVVSGTASSAPSQQERVLALVDWLEDETGRIPDDVQREVDAEYCVD